MEKNENQKLKTAVFGAGCFWGVEEVFRRTPGVVKTEVGYSGGKTQCPTYKAVCGGRTGHAETVKITYDPAAISYGELLKIFWKNHDPTTVNREGPDIGDQYRSAIFFNTEEEEKEARELKENLEKSGRFKNPIVTEITPAEPFYRAEEYHQNYFEKQERRKIPLQSRTRKNFFVDRNQAAS